MSGTYLLEIRINGGSSVDEESAESLALYPNPVKDILHIGCDNMQQYEVYSLDGKLIRSSQTNGSEDVIDFSNLESGVYMVRITSNTGVMTRRVIKE